ncbi:hypothetical protein ACW5CM_15120 [Microbacterium sp. A588]
MHLGLFDDLRDQVRIDVVAFPQNTSYLRKVATKIAPSARFHWLLRSSLSSHSYDRIIVLDSALSRMTHAAYRELERHQPETHLLLINSLGAASIALRLAKPKISWFRPGNVHTFDPQDARTQGFHLTPPTYFSSQAVDAKTATLRDAYFVGGFKGGRTDTILGVLDRLTSSGASVRFDGATDAGERVALDPPPGLILNKSWIPYREVLRHSLDSRCLVEILQGGQHAQTIRYFEAVAYNRLLLTNNPAVTTLPFYDPETMRVFTTPEDIDVDWIRNAPLPNYQYNGEFSPINLPLLKEYVDAHDPRS